MVLLVAAACFLSAGTLDWLRGWIYVALYAGGIAVSAVLVLRANPGVIAVRGRIRRDAKRFDKVILAFYIVLLFAVLIVAGLDAVRYRWRPLPFATLYWGAALHILAMVPAVWAMMVNPFAESVVRIQKDRGHRVVESGPYRLVRHPMYFGVILGNIGAPLILGSTWAFVPAGAAALLFILRATLEDTMLRNELPGYSEYSQRTRYRLFPGIW
jgi:protein-S-isoprenylcysteine O-methyltransferase Ste14